MSEIRFGITKKLNDILLEISEEIGVDKSDYVKNLIISDLRNKMGKENKKKENKKK
ncbi:MAG: hypothetical protein AABY14_03600 [Nanoarchaeota archaeon]